jgi:Phage tail tube protein
MPGSQSNLEQVYAKEESAYGTIATPVAADAFHVVVPGPRLMPDQAMIRGTEKTGVRSQPKPAACGGAITATCDIPMYVEPSGTAGIKPDGACLYKNLMGAENIISTTVASAASGSSITLTSATGVKKGSILGIGNEMRPIASLAGAVATMVVPFTSTPAAAAAVKAVNYELADPVPSSISVFSYIQQLPLASLGTVFNQGVFSFVDEGILHVLLNGLGKDVVTTPIPAQPTPVYTGTMLTKFCGAAFLDGVSAALLDMTCTINNGDVPRDIEIGAKSTSGISRGVRNVNDTFLVYLTDVNKVFYQAAKDRVNQSLFIQIGDVAGKMFSIWLPQRILNVPEIDKSKPEVQMPFTAVAWGNSNEEMVIAFG